MILSDWYWRGKFHRHIRIMNSDTIAPKFTKYQPKDTCYWRLKKGKIWYWNTVMSQLSPVTKTSVNTHCSCTSATRSSSGSSQPTLHSQWLSRKVSTGAVAASAPLTLDRIRPAPNINQEETVTVHKWIPLWHVAWVIISDRNVLVRTMQIKYIINIEVYIIGYLYIMNLINARKLEHTEIKKNCKGFSSWLMKFH